MKEYKVLYSNGEIEFIKAKDLISAQKIAHKKATENKTIVIHVKIMI